MKCGAWVVQYKNISGNDYSNHHDTDRLKEWTWVVSPAFIPRKNERLGLIGVREGYARQLFNEFKASHNWLVFTSRLHRCDGKLIVSVEVENGDMDDSYPRAYLKIIYNCPKCNQHPRAEYPNNEEDLQKFLQVMIDRGLAKQWKGISEWKYSHQNKIV